LKKKQNHTKPILKMIQIGNEFWFAVFNLALGEKQRGLV